jgi:hypothetical protein
MYYANSCIQPAKCTKCKHPEGQEVKASKRATLEDIVGYDSNGYIRTKEKDT